MLARALIPLAAWVVVPMHSAIAVDERVVAEAQDHVQKILGAPSAKRAIAWFEELVQLAEKHPADARPAVRSVLLGLWKQSNERLDTRFSARAFEGLLRQRAELDALRTKALSIIRDEEAYPYPCFAPAAAPEAVARFEASQEALDALFAKLWMLWRGSDAVRLSREVRMCGELVLWIQVQVPRVERELDLEIELPDPGVPAWLHGLPVELDGDEVDLSSFGLTRAEADALAFDRAVRAANARELQARRKRAKGSAARSAATESARLLVEINDYRGLLGLRALHWNERLERAALHHAEFLSAAPAITHEQPDPEFAGFLERAAHFGYVGPVYENCVRGPKDARSAFSSWTRSSAHHRSIVSDKVTESGVAVSRANWVQVFGLDTEFTSGIQCHPWRN